MVRPQLWPVVSVLKPSSTSTIPDSTHKREHSRRRGQYEVLHQAHRSSVGCFCVPQNSDSSCPASCSSCSGSPLPSTPISKCWTLPLYWECSVLLVACFSEALGTPSWPSSKWYEKQETVDNGELQILSPASDIKYVDFFHCRKPLTNSLNANLDSQPKNLFCYQDLTGKGL